MLLGNDMIERALIVDKPWVDLILSGDKPWEMRSRSTNIRGRIGLIQKGSGLIVGEVDLVDCLEFSNQSALYARVDKHQVEDFNLLDKWNIAWVLENENRYEEPIPYDHPQGAVIWVRLLRNCQIYNVLLI